MNQKYIKKLEDEITVYEVRKDKARYAGSEMMMNYYEGILVGLRRALNMLQYE